MKKPLRVLVVDDNEMARAMLSDFLCAFGHKVVAEAESLTQALERYRAHKPDLITLDISLPDATGLDVLKALRAEDSTVKVLIVSCTAETSSIYNDLKEAGANGFLIKPFQPAELEAAVDSLAAASD